MSIFQKIIFNILFRVKSYADKNKINYYKFVYGNGLNISDKVYFGYTNSIFIYPGSGKPELIMASGNSFRRYCSLLVSDNGKLSIGLNNFFNNSCSINCMGSIVIGDNNLFGENVKFYDHNHRFRDKNLLITDQGFSIGSITIGSNCWIGTNCTILNNVTIGDNVIIGANNLITTSIPSGAFIKSSVSHQEVDRI